MVQCETTKHDEVFVSQTISGIKIENMTSETIAYFAMEESVMARIDWEGPSCNWQIKLKSYKQVVVDSTEIMGYRKNKNIIIYYWSCPGDVDYLDMKTKSIFIQ